MRPNEIGLGLELEPHLVGFFEVRGLTIEVTAELHHGRYVCTRVTAEVTDGAAPGVSGERLRELSIPEMIETIARVSAHEDDIADKGRAAIGSTPGPTEEVLEVVATAYRYGHALGETPTREVMSLMDIPRSKAARWIAMARKTGLLEGTDERMPGGTILRESVRDADEASLRQRYVQAEAQLSAIQRERAKWEKMRQETVGSRHYTDWVEQKISEFARQADIKRENIDRITEHIAELDGPPEQS